MGIFSFLKKKKSKFDAKDFMAEWKTKTENYKKLTKEEFAALPDGELFDAALARTDSYDVHGNPEGFKNAPAPCKNFLVIVMLDAQVNNGGFNQFYFNGYDEYELDYAKAFEEVGLQKIAKLVKEATRFIKLHKTNKLTETPVTCKPFQSLTKTIP